MNHNNTLPDDNGANINSSASTERRNPPFLDNITTSGPRRDEECGINGSIQNANHNRSPEVRTPTIQPREPHPGEDVPLRFREHTRHMSRGNTPRSTSPSLRSLHDAASVRSSKNSGVDYPFSMTSTPPPTRPFTSIRTRWASTPEVHNMPDFHTYWGATLTVEAIRASPYYTRIPIPANTQHLETWRGNIDADHPLYIAIPDKPPLFTVHAVHPIPVHVLRHMANDHLQYMATFLDNEYYEMHRDCLRHQESEYREFVTRIAETQRRIVDLCVRRVKTLIHGESTWFTGLREVEDVWGRWRKVLDATEVGSSENTRSRTSGSTCTSESSC